MRHMNDKELEFAIFCIENIAIRLGVTGTYIYDVFTKKSDILYGYIVKNYGVLHTQDKEYIVDDILEVARQRGIEL